MAVSPQDVKKLRDQTGAGFGDCKEALEKAQGDFAAAEKYLKEKGLASVAKRAGRAANEGRVFAHVIGANAGLLEISCETDFVARNGDFVSTGQAILDDMVRSGLSAPGSAQDTALKDLAIKTKENLSIKSFRLIKVGEGELVQDYIHGEGRIGVLVKVKLADASKLSDPRVKQFAFDLALHAAAFNPAYLSRNQVEPAYLKEQEEILRVRDADQLVGKPENVASNIMKGKVEKLLKQICFVDQPFVKDDKLTVSQASEKLGKELGTQLTLADYAYCQIGVEN